MLRLYSITLGLSAMLMFAVQPIVSKIILPVLGGNPSVWNAVVMFFQLLLLLGYAYVHIGRELLGTHKQALLHALLLVASLFFMPLVILPELLDAAVHLQPVMWLVGVLLMTIGVPFFALSANAPMLSTWFAESKHPAAKNPYMLYAASNAGSMIGLLSYPLLVEPFLPLGAQKIIWSIGYCLLVAMIGFSLKQYLETRKQEKTKKKKAVWIKPVANTRRMLWMLLAFVPSSLMLSITAHITTDIAPIPLLWVVPLALYLLSFVFVFAHPPIGIAFSRAVYLPVLLPLMLLLGLGQSMLPVWPWFVAGAVYLAVAVLTNPNLQRQSPKQIFLPLLKTLAFFVPLVIFFSGEVTYLLLCLWYVAAFFLVAMNCHGRLSELKPRPEQLTEFYFFLSLGGALGGIFNVLVAPQVFTGYYELYLVFALSFFLLPLNRADWKRPGPIAYGLLAALAALLLYYVEYQNLGFIDKGLRAFNEWMWSRRNQWGNLGFATKPDTLAFFEVFIPVLMAFYLRRNVPALSVMLGILLLVGVFTPGSMRNVKFKDRNFFGTLEARFAEGQALMYLTNGTTQHGYQYKDRDRARTPTSYYSWDGPLGALVNAMRAREMGAGTEIAAVGLGAGTVACLAKEGQRTTFFEINPMVDKIAHTPELFSYLRDCPGSNKVVMGDARLSLRTQPDYFFSLIILDAFNSDAVPIHLLTKEALALYLEKLAPHGIIAYHISNRHLQLEKVVGNLAATQKLDGVAGAFAGSHWVFVARETKDFGALVQDPRFHLLTQDPATQVWTDDYSNIISILKFK